MLDIGFAGFFRGEGAYRFLLRFLGCGCGLGRRFGGRPVAGLFRVVEGGVVVVAQHAFDFVAVAHDVSSFVLDAYDVAFDIHVGDAAGV